MTNKMFVLVIVLKYPGRAPNVTGVEVSTGFVFPLSTQVLGYWTKYVKLRKYKQDVYFKDI